jgi:hypothetical protein
MSESSCSVKSNDENLFDWDFFDKFENPSPIVVRQAPSLEIKRSPPGSKKRNSPLSKLMSDVSRKKRKEREDSRARISKEIKDKEKEKKNLFPCQTFSEFIQELKKELSDPRILRRLAVLFGKLELVDITFPLVDNGYTQSAHNPDIPSAEGEDRLRRFESIRKNYESEIKIIISDILSLLDSPGSRLKKNYTNLVKLNMHSFFTNKTDASVFIEHLALSVKTTTV